MISAVLITKNAERHLAEVLAALRGCAEIVIVDSGSHDRTQAIAEAAGARWHHQDWLGFGPQKNHAIALARHDWILALDADEVLDATAQAALADLDLADPARAWRLRRRTFVGGRELRWGHLNDAPVRLFNRTRTRWSDAPVHESVTPAGPCAHLPGSIRHHAFADAADLFVRGGGYARAKAAVYRARGRRATAPLLLARAAAAFTRSYVLRLGALDGGLGVVSALSAAANAVTALAMASTPDTHGV
jgi:glycosyltransferase involved in cell wall biosynthesis